MWEKRVLGLPVWKKMMPSIKSRQYILKLERKLMHPVLSWLKLPITVSLRQSTNGFIPKWRSFRLFPRFCTGVAQCGQRKQAANKGRHAFRKYSMLVAAFLHKLQSACTAFKIHDATAIRMFKQYVAGPAKATVKAEVMSSTSAYFSHECPSKLYSAFEQIPLKRYVRDGNIAKLIA